MEKMRYFIISLFCLLVTVSCSQKSVQVPGTSTTDISQDSSQITERSLERPETNQAIVPSMTGPDPIKKPVVSSPSHQQPGNQGNSAVLSLGFINGRLIDYEQKLVKWNELDSQSVVINVDEQRTEAMIGCYQELQNILEGYQLLRDILLQGSGGVLASGSGGDAVDTLRQDIGFLEGTCTVLLGESAGSVSGWQQGQEVSDIGQLETQIEQYIDSGEYDEIVKIWSQIPQYQAEQISTRTRMRYGNVLMLLDQPDKAAEVYQQVVDEISASKEQPTDLMSLRKVLADLYTASGNYLSAEGQYAKIADDYLSVGQIDEWSKQQLLLLERSIVDNPELDEYAGLLRAYLGFLPERDGYKMVMLAEAFLQKFPYSPVSANVDIIKEDVQQRADQWFSSFVTKIDNAVDEKRYEEAMELLSSIPEDIISGDKLQEIIEKKEAIVLAEALADEALKREEKQELQRRWNEGVSLADKKDIDGAIEIFTGLLETEYRSKAELKIEELSLSAAKAERRKAADSFVRFTKATDSDTKKEMLVESRSILKDILVNYPDVEIADKVTGNIRRVEKEMNAIDPLLLLGIEQAEREKALQEMQEKLEQQELTEEVDVFDLPLTSPALPGPGTSAKPLPVIIPPDMQ